MESCVAGGRGSVTVVKGAAQWRRYEPPPLTHTPQPEFSSADDVSEGPKVEEKKAKRY